MLGQSFTIVLRLAFEEGQVPSIIGGASGSFQMSYPLLLCLTQGPKPEPPITNEEFLKSYVRHGAWIRALTGVSRS